MNIGFRWVGTRARGRRRKRVILPDGSGVQVWFSVHFREGGEAFSQERGEVEAGLGGGEGVAGDCSVIGGEGVLWTGEAGGENGKGEQGERTDWHDWMRRFG